MKLDWEEPISEKFQDRWQSWLQDLPKLEELEIDRCFKPKMLLKKDTEQLRT